MFICSPSTLFSRQFLVGSFFQIYCAAIYILNGLYLLNMQTLMSKPNKCNNGGEYLGYILATLGFSVVSTGSFTPVSHG